jgi:hypothetical protein
MEINMQLEAATADPRATAEIARSTRVETEAQASDGARNVPLCACAA